MSKAIELTSQDFNEEVLNSNIPVLIDFWAPWCQPCLMMVPILDELAEELGDKVKIVRMNIEIPENKQLAIQYQIRSIPNMKLFKEGRVIKEFIGSKPKEVFQQELETEL